MTLWDILKVEYGFTGKTASRIASKYDEIKSWFNLPFKSVKYKALNTLEAVINENEYTAYFDVWSVVLSRNGVTIFEKENFDNIELLQLLI